MKTLPILSSALAAIAVAGALATAAQAGPMPPTVPAAVQVPAGNKVFAVGHATGVQIYACNGTAWTFVAPRANLFDDHGRFRISHFAGPTWQHLDGSSVVGELVNPAPVEGAIPWLLLSAKSTSRGAFGNRLAKTTYIHGIGHLVDGAQGSRHRARDLLARPRADRTADGFAPAIVVHRAGLQAETGEHGRAVKVPGDLLRAAARCCARCSGVRPSPAERLNRSAATSGTARRAHFSHGASAADSTMIWRTTRQPA